MANAFHQAIRQKDPLMSRSFASVLVCIAFAPGCASQSGWTPTVDTYGNSRAQYLSQDLAECKALAEQSSGGTASEAGKGAAVGGLLGAATGAAIGAAFGSAGRGAAVGATVGGVGGGRRKASQAEATYKRAYSNCMRGRGHNVID